MDEKQERLYAVVSFHKRDVAEARSRVGIDDERMINVTNLKIKSYIGVIAESLVVDSQDGVAQLDREYVGCLFCAVLCITEVLGVCIERVVSPLRSGICEINSGFSNRSVLDVFNQMAKSILYDDNIHTHGDFEIIAWAQYAIVTLMAFAGKLGFPLIDCVVLPDDEQ